ncbi:MAG: DUF2974 domain-containing protein [Lachnospiraceae bacterium]|nr:DUF2974 domain-containing protein [Lachnospiraceae bacterium]
MGTILDYLKEYGGYTLEEKPFSDVDSLILSQFAYLKFDGMVPGPEEAGQTVTLYDLVNHASYDHLYADERYREDNMALFLGVYRSRRFGDMRIGNYVNRIEPERETQFSAVTYWLSDGTCYVAYRGTDESIVGWKEDFNLAFSEPVPAQLMSVEYLEQAAQRIEGDFCVGGHSKGGNLAVYAAMNCREEVRRRIGRIYDHDGPGFRPEVKRGGAYREIEERIHKTIPRSSLVGMLLYSDGVYQVVESRTLGVAQHNPYTWLVDGDHFHIVDEIRAGRKFMDEALNQWILSLSQEQVHTFVDTFYQIVLASETDNLIDFTGNWFQSMHKIGVALKEVDPETGKAIIRIMKSLFDIMSANAKERFKVKTELQKERFDEGISQLELLFKK